MPARSGRLLLGVHARAVRQVPALPSGAIRGQAVVTPSERAAELVVLGEFAQVVQPGHVRAVEARACIVERRGRSADRKVCGGIVVVGSAVEDVLDRKPFGLGRGVLPRVVGFEVDHRLPPGTDAHGEERAVPQRRRPARTAAQRPRPSGFGMRLQPEVDGCAVAEYDVLERLDRLVVLHHFDARHVLRRDVVGRLSVTAVEHVQPFDVKVVDRLAVVAYLARFRHLDARHLAQYVGDRAVLRLGEARHVVAYGVAPEAQPRGADRHLADVGRLGRQPHEHPPGVGRNRLPAVAHRREVELRGCPVPARPEHEIARGRGSRVTQRLAQGVPRRDDGPGDGRPVLLVGHVARVLLGLGGDCAQRPKQGQ